MRSVSIAVLVMLTGCDLYFTDGDDEPPCYDVATDVAPAVTYRNPETGECQYFGGYPCDGRCGPCAETGVKDPIAQPDWGSCYSQCDGLDEKSCMGTTGCFATYVEYGDAFAPSYNGCWQTAPSGPVGGSCANLDAQECSRHDNCTATYVESGARTSDVVLLDFQYCAAEGPKSCTGVSCPPGSHCDEQCDAQGICKPVCVPDVNGCTAMDCGPGYECVEVCSDGGGGFCGTCEAQCVPTTACEALQTEAACTSRADCTPVYQGDDCTCYPSYCECNILTYDRCETK